MNYPYPTNLAPQDSTFAIEKRRQRLIAAAISYKNGMTTEVEPSHRHALSQFALGRLTIDEVVYYLEAAVPNGVSER